MRSCINRFLELNSSLGNQIGITEEAWQDDVKTNFWNDFILPLQNTYAVQAKSMETMCTTLENVEQEIEALL